MLVADGNEDYSPLPKYNNKEGTRFKAKQYDNVLSFSRSSVCNELNIRFSNYVQRSCRKKIKGISGNNNTSNRMLTGLVFFRRGKKESRFLDLVANRTWCVVLNPMAGNRPKFLY